MYKFKLLTLFLFLTIYSYSQTPFISEINYGTDSGIEIAGPIDASLNGWSLEFYEWKRV